MCVSVLTQVYVRVYTQPGMCVCVLTQACMRVYAQPGVEASGALSTVSLMSAPPS